MKKSKHTVEITKEGSNRAKPAIWYAGMEGRRFVVWRSKEWPTMYEVQEGEYKSKVIYPAHCKEASG